MASAGVTQNRQGVRLPSRTMHLRGSSRAVRKRRTGPLGRRSRSSAASPSDRAKATRGNSDIMTLSTDDFLPERPPAGGGPLC